MIENECCGTCKWNTYDSEYDCFYCSNDESEYTYYETAYNDVCADWERKE